MQTERQCEDEQCGERAVSHRVCSTTDTETQSAESVAGEDTSSVADRGLQPAPTSVSAALCHDIRRKYSALLTLLGGSAQNSNITLCLRYITVLLKHYIFATLNP